MVEGRQGGPGVAGRPNIIFILADDLGYGDLGSFGQKKIHTPNLDVMAAQGMQFSRFYCGTAVCAPSRSVFMTGQHTGHTPIRGNRAVAPEGQWPLPDSAVTVAQLLKKAGYTTGDFGKWGLGYIGTSGDPLKKGFDHFFGYNCQAEAHNYYPDHLWKDDERVNYPNTPEKENYYSADIIQEHALDFITENKDRPFFLYLSYTIPHAALQVPEDSVFEAYKLQFGEKRVDVKKPWDGKGYEPQAYPHTAYAAMVSRLDSYVGEVFRKLKALGLDKHTLVIFASDNGPHVEGGNEPAFFNSNGGLRGAKRDLYEGGIRTPMIAWYPGKIRAGAKSDYIGAFWDLLPTFAELAGVNPLPRKHIDGVSIVPTLLSRSGQEQHTYLYWEFHESGGRQAVRMGKWKGVRYDVMKDPDGRIELYDLDKDPAEEHDIADQHSDIADRLKGIMRQAHAPNADFPFFKNEGTQ
jgi:arylsulfatase A-like enzyme